MTSIIIYIDKLGFVVGFNPETGEPDTTLEMAKARRYTDREVALTALDNLATSSRENDLYMLDITAVFQ